MRHLSSLFILLCMSCAVAGESDRDSDLAGAWITQVTSQTPLQQLLIFKRQGGTWSGTMTTRFGTMTLKDIVLAAGQISFSQSFDVGLGPVSPIRVNAVLHGEELQLRIPTPTGGYVDRSAHRASAKEAATVQPATLKPRSFPALPDNGLARTPPMGWNSWNKFAMEIDDHTVREIADALVSSGLRDAGYIYVNVDDGWQGERDAKGLIRPNAKFPDMRALADYVHHRGLKFGLYSGPGSLTCGGRAGSYGHEEQDAKTYAEWGVDYLKYDFCSAGLLYSTPAEMQAAYHKMGSALQASGRPILYSLCQYGLFDVGKWGRKVGGNTWRTTYDIADYWGQMDEIAVQQIGRESDGRPGGWNDPDMLEVGNGGMTLEEYRTHMTWWAMLSAPLLLGNDVRHMTPEIIDLLTNPEVIAIDQDPLGIPAQAAPVSTEFWTKSLANGDVAVALVNRDASPASRQIRWSQLGLTEVAAVRDLWRHADLEVKPEGYAIQLPPHGSILLRVSSKKR